MTLKQSLKEVKKASSLASEIAQKMKQVFTPSLMAEYLGMTTRSVNLKIQTANWNERDLERLSELEIHYQKLIKSIPQ